MPAGQVLQPLMPLVVQVVQLESQFTQLFPSKYCVLVHARQAVSSVRLLYVGAQVAHVASEAQVLQLATQTGHESVV